MTIWVLHQPLTPDEETHIHERTHLQLPFEGLPDLSMVGGIGECRQLVKALHPDDPPESITSRVGRFWHLYTGLQIEDTLAVPLPASQSVMLAEVTGRYEYRVGEQGADVHLVPVKWYEKRIPLRAFGKHKDIFTPRSEKMIEVIDRETRIAIRDRLPHSYNRFSRWKWLMVLFFLMSLVRMVAGQGTAMR